jgi:phosphohistidine phosphatase
VRTLWLLRHAKAVADPPPGGSDFDRTLAPRGRRDAAALGHLLRGDGSHLGLAPDVPLPSMALVSPAARTMATAQLVLGEFDRQPKVHEAQDFYDADAEHVLTRLRSLPGEVASVMVVGHNPTTQLVAQSLIDPDDPAGADERDLLERRGLPTCALSVLSCDVERWRDVGHHSARLVGFFTPPFDRS